MARKHEAENLLRKGLLPSEIAVVMGISPKSVVQYLQTRVGEGALRFSEIYFSWPAAKRDLLAETADEVKRRRMVNNRRLSERGLAREDLEFFQSLRQRRVFAGDLYEHLAETELAVHDMVRRTLIKQFGDGEASYWRQGIPVNIRKRCHERREDDSEPNDSPFQYTTLIELAEIIGKNWPLFQPDIPKPYAANKQALLSDFARLNRIRNAVMHPVKRRRWSEDDFEFAKRLRAAFERFRDA
jgi:hypothetical protein